MSLTHPKYQKLRDLILKSEGKCNSSECKRLKELGYNCCDDYISEISLDRILMALDKISQCTLSNGVILVRNNSKDYDPIKWELCKPLHEQPEETWDQLVEILS